MPDYKNGKIYAIRSKQTPQQYIGSTCRTLRQRFSAHKSAFKLKQVNDKVRVGQAHNILKYDDCYIELIENFPCESKKELLDREGYFIRRVPCVNIQIHGRTMEEYIKDNEEKLKRQSKEYYEKNKEELIIKGRQYKKDNVEKLKEKRKEYDEKK